MSWKLRTEIDLESGQSYRFFVFESDEGNIALPEDLGFLLIKDMLKTFPDACQALVNELAKERMEPQPKVPRAPRVTPLIGKEEEEEEEPETTPLKLPDQAPAVTLGDMAPKRMVREKDVPQG